MDRKRELKGIRLLLAPGGIKQYTPSSFLVRSQSNPGTEYEVKWERNHWMCTCADYAKHHRKCKHIHAVCYYLAIRGVSSAAQELAEEAECPRCRSGDSVIRKGVRYNRSGPVQRYYCKRCRVKFVGRTAFTGMKNRAAVVVAALDLYFRGLSLRQVAQHLEVSYGINITHATIHNWLKKYVELVGQYVKTLTVETSEKWHADETLVRVGGRHMVLWGLLDSEARFLIANHISWKRGKADARELMKRGMEISKSKPIEVVTDGLPSYATAIEKECAGQGHPIIHLQGPLKEALNNKMERFFGVVKTRTKTMCRFNSEEGARRFAEGFAIHHNFIKAHRALNERTPAQAIGLRPSKSSWLDMITTARNSSKPSAKKK